MMAMPEFVGETVIKGRLQFPEGVFVTGENFYASVTIESDPQDMTAWRSFLLPIGSNSVEFSFSIPKYTSYKWRLKYEITRKLHVLQD